MRPLKASPRRRGFGDSPELSSWTLTGQRGFASSPIRGRFRQAQLQRKKNQTVSHIEPFTTRGKFPSHGGEQSERKYAIQPGAKPNLLSSVVLVRARARPGQEKKPCQCMTEVAANKGGGGAGNSLRARTYRTRQGASVCTQTARRPTEANGRALGSRTSDRAPESFRASRDHLPRGGSPIYPTSHAIARFEISTPLEP